MSARSRDKIRHLKRVEVGECLLRQALEDEKYWARRGRTECCRLGQMWFISAQRLRQHPSAHALGS